MNVCGKKLLTKIGMESFIQSVYIIIANPLTIVFSGGGNNKKIKTMRAQNRHDIEKWKKKKHPSSKCGNAKCLVCHSGKVLKIPNKQRLIEKSKITNQ